MQLNNYGWPDTIWQIDKKCKLQELSFLCGLGAQDRAIYINMLSPKKELSHFLRCQINEGIANKVTMMRRQISLLQRQIDIINHDIKKIEENQKKDQ